MSDDIKHQTLYFDTEKSGESYVHLYEDEPGIPDGEPLWPAPIPVVGVSGKIGQGKTTFLLDIAGGPVRRIDVPAEMLKLKPTGYRPIDVFTWFHAVVRSIPPGKFRVIAVDVAEEIEQGVAEWVWENPLHFNTTRQQFIKMSGVYQGLVSSFWKSILMDITSRCETFAFANHVGQVFDGSGKAVAGKEKSKGRPVMKQGATLYINLHREKDAAGNLRDKPAGVVDLSEGGKSRLMTKVVRNGVRVRVPVLPPRMPIATPAAIREYYRNPPDSAHFKAEERAPERAMTDDDRVEAQTALAAQQAEVERLRIERISEERKQAAAAQDDSAAAAVFTSEPSQAGGEAPAETSPTTSPNPSAPPLPGTAATVTPEEHKASRRAKLPQGSIVEWLASQPAPVQFFELARAMHAAHGVDSDKVHKAAKTLAEAGTLKVVILGEQIWIGMLPNAKFPTGEWGRAGEKTPTAIPAEVAPPVSHPPVGTNGYHRPANLPVNLQDSVRVLWEEFAIVCNKWTRATADDVWKSAVLARYGAFTGNELTQANLDEIERNLVGKIETHYAAIGAPDACPFRAAP